ncbi:hypothetical protein WN943_012981 [Citrus x changshan-huyou]
MLSGAFYDDRRVVYKGGAYLYVPLGKWLTSNLTLFLERGATILGSQMPDYTLKKGVEPFHLMHGGRYHSLINRHNAFDIFLVSCLHSTVPLPGNDASIDGNVQVQNETAHAPQESISLHYSCGVIPPTLSVLLLQIKLKKMNPSDTGPTLPVALVP